jgi:hypothetical protein
MLSTKLYSQINMCSVIVGLNTTQMSVNTTDGIHKNASEKAAEDQTVILSAALIAVLTFGVLFFFAVLVLIGKRVFDSWQRRHYSRIDYLVNGMYN